MRTFTYSDLNKTGLLMSLDDVMPGDEIILKMKDIESIYRLKLERIQMDRIKAHADKIGCEIVYLSNIPLVNQEEIQKIIFKPIIPVSGDTHRGGERNYLV